MELNLKGKSVIVTAASKGIGKAVAKEFAKEGARVLISSRSEDALREAVKEIKEDTGNNQVDFVVCNMKDAEAIDQLMEKARAWNGTVDVLINNAGGPPAGSFMEMGDDDWYHAFELNLLSFIRTTRAVVPMMQKQQGGHIINIASSSIKQSLDDLVLSNTMRPGIVGLAKTLAQELSKDNILVNTVGPGTIKTDRILNLNKTKAEQQQITEEQVMQETEKQIPMNRVGKPEEFAKAVVFLGSGANTYITGQALLIDGGQVKAL